jgi:aarF domain-containing kinase
MGQHMATLVVLPVEWTSTMKILQDRCEPTPYSALEDLFLVDMGVPVTELFDDFDPTPIGVASLAQVHVGHHRASGQKVAVKVSVFLYEFHLLSISQEATQFQHPHLAEFCDIDMEMVEITVGLCLTPDYSKFFFIF